MCSLYLPLLAALTWLALSTSTSAFPLNVTVSQQCTPLNVTWKAVPESFPYTVWIAANHGFVQTYRINSDYQPGAEYITFQYIVPPPSGGFTSYTVAVGDSRGDGNTTQALGINTPSTSSSDCPAFSGSAAFTYAADPRNGSMIQCGAVHFYNVGDRGTRPFTISFIPLGGTPVSVQVPDRYTLNTSNFDYQTLVPFAQGTQFQTVLGDASGPGSGGASAIFTVGPSTFSLACLAENYQLPDTLSVALPIATTVATYSNLPGAISNSAPSPHSSDSKSTGAIAGGAIGGAIALGVAIGCLIAFLLYRRRQRTKRNLARSEEVRFVDLDSDDGDEWAAARPSRSRSSRRNGNSPAEDATSARRSYAVSPFVYEPRHHTDSSMDRGNGQSLEMTSRNSTNPSYGESLSAAGLASSSAGVSPSSDDYPPHAGTASMHSQPSSQFRHNPFSTYTAVPSGSSVESSGAMLHSASAATATSSKAQAAAAQARRDHRAPRRVVQHTDGGALPQPSSDTEDEEVVDELPPEYGGWLQNSGGAGGSTNASGNASIPQAAAAAAAAAATPTQSHHGGGAAGYDAPRGAS